jgi:hypothetical protein
VSAASSVLMSEGGRSLTHMLFGCSAFSPTAPYPSHAGRLSVFYSILLPIIGQSLLLSCSSTTFLC